MVVSEPLAPGARVRDDQVAELTADSVPLASAGLIPPPPPESCNLFSGLTALEGAAILLVLIYSAFVAPRRR
jgi:hypothetical protein